MDKADNRAINARYPQPHIQDAECVEVRYTRRYRFSPYIFTNHTCRESVMSTPNNLQYTWSTAAVQDVEKEVGTDPAQVAARKANGEHTTLTFAQTTSTLHGATKVRFRRGVHSGGGIAGQAAPDPRPHWSVVYKDGRNKEIATQVTLPDGSVRSTTTWHVPAK